LSVMRCTFLLIVLGRTASTDYTATSFLFHTPEINIAPKTVGCVITNCSRGIRNAWHFHYALVLVLKVVCVGIGIALLTP
ncbi:hypothetical protein, partial [Vibrio parahaemolyticus]|uniref:hypothetical protein n=1 Tax=Vibrio parahaemolyticus TaxID=670 RepID=UPI0030811915